MTRKLATVAPKTPATVTDPAIHDAGPALAPGPQLASDAANPVASHVHDLQDLLARRLDPPAPTKWSAQATVSFVVLVCGGFWAAVVLAIRLLLH